MSIKIINVYLHITCIVIDAELDQVGVSQLQLLNHGVKLDADVGPQMSFRKMSNVRRPPMQRPIPEVMVNCIVKGSDENLSMKDKVRLM